MTDSALSGRLDVVETNIGYLTVQLATRPDLAAFQDLARSINQSISSLRYNYDLIREQLQALNSLYANLNNSVVTNYTRFTGHTGNGDLHQEQANQITVNSDQTLLYNQNVILVSNSTQDIAITVPSVVSSSGLFYYFKKIDAGTYKCDITGAALIDGSGFYLLSGQNSSVTLYSNGSSWNIF